VTCAGALFRRAADGVHLVGEVVDALHGGKGGGQRGGVAVRREGVGPQPAVLLVVLGRGRVLVVVERVVELRGLERAARTFRAKRRYPSLAPRRRAASDLGIVVVAALGEARGLRWRCRRRSPPRTRWAGRRRRAAARPSQSAIGHEGAPLPEPCAPSLRAGPAIHPVCAGRWRGDGTSALMVLELWMVTHPG